MQIRTILPSGNTYVSAECTPETVCALLSLVRVTRIKRTSSSIDLVVPPPRLWASSNHATDVYRIR